MLNIQLYRALECCPNTTHIGKIAPTYLGKIVAAIVKELHVFHVLIYSFFSFIDKNVAVIENAFTCVFFSYMKSQIILPIQI